MQPLKFPQKDANLRTATSNCKYMCKEGNAIEIKTAWHWRTEKQTKETK